MRKVNLRMKEMDKYEKIKELVEHGGNKNRVALKLGLRHYHKIIILSLITLLFFIDTIAIKVYNYIWKLKKWR